MTQLSLSPAPKPIMVPIISEALPEARTRFLEFFAAAIRNPNTRRAYARASRDFLAWCRRHGVRSGEHRADPCRRVDRGTGPVAFGADRQAAARHGAASVQLAGDRTGLAVQPGLLGARPLAFGTARAHAGAGGRGSARSYRKHRPCRADRSKRPRADRAHVYSFARIGAALARKREDVFVQGRRLWVRLHEKVGQAARDALPPPAGRVPDRQP